jgi:membrane-bound lytic murein transglycosylase B
MQCRAKGTVLIGILIATWTATAMPAFAEDFHSWLANVRSEARAAGISDRIVNEALPDTLEPDERILRLDRKQPEGGLTFERYKNNVITKYRLIEGRRKVAEYKTLLHKVGASYGVEPSYIAALWGIETNFGAYTGGFETIPALVTLSYEGRRGQFFKEELFKALRMVDQGKVKLHEMRGSWAGAMGQCQFMPTSFEKYAQDFDKDGKSDIWNTKADVFASTAAYLSMSGWKKGEPWGVHISLPKNFNPNMIGPKVQKSAEFWRSQGLKVPATFASGEMLSVIQSGGEGYKSYIVGDNYRILLKWNTSTYFATAVGLLADQLKS